MSTTPGSRKNQFWPLLSLLILIIAGLVVGWVYMDLSGRVSPHPQQSFWTGKKGSEWTGIIRFEKTGFSQMNVQLILGSTLKFSNPSQKALDLKIVTWRGKVASELHIPAGGKAQWIPKTYGVYDFYDATTTTFGSFTIPGSDGERAYQVVARKSSPYYPAPAYGVVAVTNANGGGIPLSSHYGPHEVPGVSTLTGKHFRPFMNQPPWIEVPGGTMTFKPWVVVIRADTPLQLYNYDGMDHSFFPGVYPVMLDDHGRINFYHVSFQGIVLHKNGGRGQIMFHRPGMYHILCTIHSYPWGFTYKSHHFFGGFPYIMDVIVIVEPAKRA